MSHTAPDASSSSGDNVEESMPDFYTHPEYYSSDPGPDAESIRQIKAAKGDPNAPVKIYRSVPPGVDSINSGDWVSTSREYAQQHGRHADDPSQDWPVIESTARAGDLHTDGNSINEWGWHPQPEQQHQQGEPDISTPSDATIGSMDLATVRSTIDRLRSMGQASPAIASALKTLYRRRNELGGKPNTSDPNQPGMF